MSKIKYTFEDEIARITMDDGKANAINWEFFEEMGEALDLTEQVEAKVLVFTGRLGFFSAGLDLKLLPTLSPEERGKFSTTFARTMLRIFTFPVPTIAACTGHAIAGGAMLTFACDRRFALDGPYRIQMNETIIGIPLPKWMFLDKVSQYEMYAKPVLVGTFTLWLVVTGVILPVIEELYFRGYLQPRLSRFGIWAAFINAALFALYHFWQPFDFFGIFLLGLLFAVLVWWKRNVRLSIVLHILGNLLLRVTALMAVFEM